MVDYHSHDVDYYGGDGGDYYEDEEFDDDPSDPYMSPSDIYNQCLEPTGMEAFHQVVWLLSSCLVLRLLNHHLQVGSLVQHLVSTGLGLVALFSIVGSTAVFTVIPASLGYLVVRGCAPKPVDKSDKSKRASGRIANAQIATICLVCYLVVREHIGILPESWEQVRGIQMIMVMKILSISFDLGVGAKLPAFHEYLGYIFCPANVIFGPWIPFDIYCRLFPVKGRETSTQTEILGVWWVFPAFGAGICSFLSLGVSSCLLHWLFLGTESRWLLTFRDALAVRFSHYFISFLSELCCLLGGFSDDRVITVTEPWRIECPRSLVDVVVCWNKPMHRWLRVYIFGPCQAWGPFKAVLVTFAVSSMLHGLNFGLTSVLLTLGGYTFAEHKLREKLAVIYDACIRSRKCPSNNCPHKHKPDNVAVLGINLAFGLLACFNLAYLGVMISKGEVESGTEFGDANAAASTNMLTSIYEDIKKWSDLGFLSHLVMIFIYLATLVI